MEQQAPHTMIPARGRRRFRAESVLMRVVATAGIVALGVLLGAILVSSDVQGWIVGLVVAVVSVVLAAVLWSSRQL
jgi:protein-S-isoprenylcysteine O-methyltransferase Ste14